MNPRTTHSIRRLGLILLMCSLPIGALTASPSSGSETAPDGLKSLGGSFVVFDSAAGGSACWAPSTTQTFCFRAESFTDDWEWV